METIKAKVTFDETSHLGAFRIHMWHRYQVWLMLRTFLSIAILLAGIILLSTEGPHPLPVLMLMVGTFALLRPLIWKIMHARNLRKLPGYGQTVIYTFTPECMSIHGEDREGEVKWIDLLECITNKKGLLLYHSKKSYTWVPVTSFDNPDEMKQVSEWATAQ
ncbi:MAG: YcxB family protein [Akkermansiaceae bacterium]